MRPALALVTPCAIALWHPLFAAAGYQACKTPKRWAIVPPVAPRGKTICPLWRGQCDVPVPPSSGASRVHLPSLRAFRSLRRTTHEVSLPAAQAPRGALAGQGICTDAAASDGHTGDDAVSNHRRFLGAPARYTVRRALQSVDNFRLRGKFSIISRIAQFASSLIWLAF